jgi:hypothetical protein
MPSRTTEDVFLDHLDRAQQGDVAGDLAHNFSPDCVLLTSYGVFRGHDGVRAAAALLDEQVGRTEYEYRTKMVDGDIAFLEWTAESEGADRRRGGLLSDPQRPHRSDDDPLHGAG